MRLALTFALLTTPLIAEDFYAPAPVVAATVYAYGAEVVQESHLDLPAGRHKVFLPFINSSYGSNLPRVNASDGVVIEATTFVIEMDIDRTLLQTDTQRTAITEYDLLWEGVLMQQDRIRDVENSNRSREVSLAFLAAIRPPENGASPAELTTLAALVQQQTADILTEIADGTQELRVMKDKLADLEWSLEAAGRALRRLDVPVDMEDMLVLSVFLEHPTEVVFTQISFEEDVWWITTYDMFLNTNDSPELVIKRGFSVKRYENVLWQEVTLTLSTITPKSGVAPWTPHPNLASIFLPEVVETFSDQAMGRVAAPILEPSVIVEEDTLPIIQIDGVALEYVYPQKVTIAQEEIVQLAHDQVSFAVETEIHASPRRDDTAFFMAVLENTSVEPLLPGTVRFHRDGHFMGEGEIELIPAGASATLPFGPVEGLRLDHVIARNQTGDTGVFTRANTRSQQISFSVENLTGEPQEVKVFYPLVFSEQEDLEIDLNVTPAPDQVDIDDKRGVSMWLMNLAVGDTQSVAIDARLDWPDGQELRWVP